MSQHKKKGARKKTRNTVSCSDCRKPSFCCQTGAWADLEEAKKIVALGLKGEFFQLEKDEDFPSGYRIGTSYRYNSCSFLDRDGLCSIHKVDYSLKPKSCKDFPYENDKVSPFADELCALFKAKAKIKNKRH